MKVEDSGGNYGAEVKSETNPTYRLSCGGPASQRIRKSLTSAFVKID
jgi:hypothetical protein